MRSFFSRKNSGYATVPPARAQELLATGAVLVDVRDASEWRAGHVPGAHHVPLVRIVADPDALQIDAPVIVMCASGMRSRRAASVLAERGRREVYNLDGGITSWMRAGLPVVK